MRIAHVTDSSIFNYDGISTYVNELLKCACDREEPALVLMPPPLLKDERRVVRHTAMTRVFPKVGAFSSDKFIFAVPAGMSETLEQFDPDLVWIHTIGPLGLAAARLARRRWNTLYTKHCFDGDLWCQHLRIHPMFHWFFQSVAMITERWLLQQVDKALYHFDDTGKLRNRRFLPKFEYIPPQINARFLKEPSKRVAKSRNGALTLGFCGRLDAEKGLERLFEAAEILRRDPSFAPVRLLLIGEGEVGRELERRFSQLDVTITGFVDDVIPHLDSLDAFVLASKTETTSLSSLEAYARGLPVFSTRVGFLGLNPGKFSQVRNFETAAELARLLHQFVAQHESARVRNAPTQPHPDIITFSRLYERVTAHEEIGVMLPRRSAFPSPRHRGKRARVATPL